MAIVCDQNGMIVCSKSVWKVTKGKPIVKELESVDEVVPPYHAMFWPTHVALNELGDSGSIIEIDDRASSQAVKIDINMLR